MSAPKKFQFKAPSSAALAGASTSSSSISSVARGSQKPFLNVKARPLNTNDVAGRVQHPIVTKESQSKAAIENADDDDLFTDDIDVEMLIQATQMVEASASSSVRSMEGCTEEERMDIDDQALSMFIREEDNRNGMEDWSSSKSSGERFNQTQTIFQGNNVSR